MTIAKNPTTTIAPTNGVGTVTGTSIAIGTVTGVVTAGEDTDSFVVDITDGFNGNTTATVQVAITPLSVSAIDQRGTTVAVNTQQMYFYSQADTDKALGLLKAAGVNTIRILLPWAGVEPADDTFDWSAVGAAGYFDALAFHPYQYAKPFSAQEGHAGVPFTQAQQLHAVMVANGDGHKKIWATEYGQPASEGGEATQAAFVGDFLRAWRSLEFAGPAFIHTFADYPDPSPDQASLGLFRLDWTPKPVVAVVTQVIAENQAINAAGGILA